MIAADCPRTADSALPCPCVRGLCSDAIFLLLCVQAVSQTRMDRRRSDGKLHRVTTSRSRRRQPHGLHILAVFDAGPLHRLLLRREGPALAARAIIGRVQVHQGAVAHRAQIGATAPNATRNNEVVGAPISAPLDAPALTARAIIRRVQIHFGAIVRGAEVPATAIDPAKNDDVIGDSIGTELKSPPLVASAVICVVKVGSVPVK